MTAAEAVLNGMVAVSIWSTPNGAVPHTLAYDMPYFLSFPIHPTNGLTNMVGALCYLHNYNGDQSESNASRDDRAVSFNGWIG
jgi:hypothetical protein